ncbi:hypothetical protein [Sporosarcina highlanderae]|uniref:Uncharacterized protein n=1 Tax=Sporosarcina highlanderae TaxID=3035916 RepID=A0ABT8JVF2_9BACL|nr:hypothetical protein [Sporosarcina highlanderae]MDN4609159.1 hypothetical protein [Sporosarcina highlanderae]
MKLSTEQVQRIVELQKRVVAVGEEFDYMTIHKHGVQMMHETFLETFEVFAVSSRECDVYPYEVSTVAGGVKIFTIMSAAEVVALGDTHPDKFDYISRAIQMEGVK